MEVAVVNQVRLKREVLRRGRAFGTSDELVLAAKHDCQRERINNDDASRLGEIPGGWRFAAKMAADEGRKGSHGWLRTETQRAAKLGCGLKR